MIYICSHSLYNNESKLRSDLESLPNLDEFLASSFDRDISDNEEEVGVQENADSLGLELRALSLWAIFVRYRWQGFRVRGNHNQTLSLAAAATEGTLTLSPSKCRLVRI